MRLLWFLLKRTLWLFITLWVIYTFSFFLMRAVPGGPFASEKNVPEEIKRNIEAKFKLDRPLYEQYFTMMGSYLMGDFLPSYSLRDYTVDEVIAEGFPISASLGIMAMVFALTLGLTAGVVSALRRQSWLDIGLMGAATLGIAVPNFILAGLAVILFVFMLHVFPAAGWGTLRQIMLPALCLGAPFAAYIARLDAHEHAGSAGARLHPHGDGQGAIPPPNGAAARHARRPAAGRLVPWPGHRRHLDRLAGAGTNLRLARHGNALHPRGVGKAITPWRWAWCWSTRCCCTR